MLHIFKVLFDKHSSKWSFINYENNIVFLSTLPKVFTFGDSQNTTFLSIFYLSSILPLSIETMLFLSKRPPTRLLIPTDKLKTFYKSKNLLSKIGRSAKLETFK